MFLINSCCILSPEKLNFYQFEGKKVLCVNQSDQAWKSQVKVRAGAAAGGDVGDNFNQIFSGDTSQPAPSPTMHPTDGQKREKTVLFPNFSHPTLFCELRKDLTWSDLENALVGHCTKPLTFKGFLLPCLGLSFPFFPIQSLRFAHTIYLRHLFLHSHHNLQRPIIFAVTIPHLIDWLQGRY